MKKGPGGRPKKKEDRMDSRQYGRAAIVMCAYDEARKKGEKHSIAVRYAVDSFRQRSSRMRISETEVKRILSRFRPKGRGAILLFERSTLSEEDIKRRSWIREQIAGLYGEKGITLAQLPVYDETRREKFTIRFSERPDYSRHNRKGRID